APASRPGERSGCGDPFFGESLLRQAAGPEQSVQCALVALEHGVGGAGAHALARDVEDALAVTLDRGYQLELLDRRPIPRDAGHGIPIHHLCASVAEHARSVMNIRHAHVTTERGGAV